MSNYLHLRRRAGQAIVIGTPPMHVVMTVGETVNGETTLHFIADRSIPIDRVERLEAAKNKSKKV